MSKKVTHEYQQIKERMTTNKFVAIRFVIRRYLWISLVAISFSFVAISGIRAEAARLYFSPQEQVIGTEKEFSVVVNIDAENRVNTLFIAVLIPTALTPYDVNEANSIINLWVDKPHWDEGTRLLTFSGIIPGGFQGQGAPLLIIKFKVETDKGTALLAFDKEKTEVYLHTPDGIEDSLVLETITLPIVKGKENLPLVLADNDPPESFKPEIAKDSAIFEGKYFLVFVTQDKASGIAGYFVHESTQKKEITRIDTDKWVEAESPYVLKDQKLRSYVYVKAVDKAGNERIVVVPPQRPLKWYEYPLVWIIIGLGVVILYIFRKILWKITH